MEAILRCLGLLLLAARASAAPDDKGFQTVVVQPGTTLWTVSHTWLKDPAGWGEILKHNRLPSGAPAAALPGMTLRVPAGLIKDEMRAARLVYVRGRVAFRNQEAAGWRAGREDAELRRGDTLRTFEGSKARVRFADARVLSLDQGSAAVIRPMARDYDVELKAGSVFAGSFLVATVSALIAPMTADTEYSAKVRPDLGTVVEVHRGAVLVDALGKTVEVPAGMSTEVRLGMPPGSPRLIADLAGFKARAADFQGEQAAGRAWGGPSERAAAEDLEAAGDMDALSAAIKALSFGQPASAYHVQASRGRGFASLAYDRTYSLGEELRLRDEDLPPGVYWWRVAVIDLLGAELPFTAPCLYAKGAARGGGADLGLRDSFRLINPAGDETVFEAAYRVTGRVEADDMTVLVDGKPARRDESGNFSATLKLKPGPNAVVIKVRDASGRAVTTTRRVTLAAPTAEAGLSMENPIREVGI